MSTNMFYNIVKEYAEAFVKQKSDYISIENTSLCAVLTSSHDVFAGITGISLCNGSITTVPAEIIAVNAMFSAGQTKARQMITISLSDFKVVPPDKLSAELVIQADDENSKCEIFVSKNESVKAYELLGESDMNKAEEFFEGFDGQDAESSKAGKNAFEKMGLVSDNGNNSESQDKKSELGAPADFSTGFDVDVTNPFYEAPVNEKSVETIATIAGNHGETTAKETAPSKPAPPTMSKEDLLKQAKKKKKIAKAIFSTRRK